MTDRRFPHLRPVSELGRADATRFAGEVCRRTECSCAFNRFTGELFFYRGHMERGVWSVRYKRPNGEFLALPTTDDVSATINSGKMPRRLKELMIDRARREDEHRRAAAHQQYLDDMDDEAGDRLEHMLHKSQMGRHSQRLALVDGLKG